MRGARDGGTALALGSGGGGGGWDGGRGLGLVFWERREPGRGGGLGAAAVGEGGDASQGTEGISGFLKFEDKPCS